MDCHHGLEHSNMDMGMMFQDYGNVFLTLLIAGLIGSFTHCAGMCGPFVIGQSCSKLDNVKAKDLNKFSRLKAAALMPYHMGRMTTYTILGIIAALVTQKISDFSQMKYIATTLLIVAGTIFIATALKGVGIIKISNQKPSKFANILSKISAPFMLNSKNRINGYILGILLGLLPCGFLYGAIMVVAATKDPIVAAIAMSFFTIGTIPALFMLGMGSQLGLSKWKSPMQKLGRVIMGLNGFGLFYIAAKNLM